MEKSAGGLNRYPDPSAMELRSRIGAYLGVTTDEVVVGAGSLGVLQQIVTAHCDPGDEVVFAWRSFEAYPLVVRLASAVPVPVPLRADEAHDLDAMAAAITPRTRVVVLCTPNNPTGVALGEPELERFLEAVPPHVLVVIDEAYIEYGKRGESADAIALYRRWPQVCVLRTFSKAHGLAALRVGYAITRPSLADGLRRSGLPFAVNTLAQHAAIASIDATDAMRDRVDAVVTERTRMITALRLAGWTTPDSAANFVWLRASDDLRERLVAHLAEQDILVRGYGGDGVRVTVADRAANDRVLTALGATASWTHP